MFTLKWVRFMQLQHDSPKITRNHNNMNPVIEHLPRLRRYATALTRDQGRAEDLLQDTLERAYRKWHLWTPGGSLRAWLFSIMHNVYMNQLARESRRPIAVSLDEAMHESSNGPSDTQHATRDLLNALAKLPDEQREVVLLVCLEDMKYEEVAYVLRIPIGTVRSRLARGRERLRRLMEGLPSEDNITTFKVVK